MNNSNGSKKVLIVDDDLVLATMVSEVLIDEGFTVLVEHDGEAGLATARTAKPDLVLLDVMMPKLSGPEVVVELRKEAWASTLPILLLTNVNQPETGSVPLENDPLVEHLLKTDWTIEQIVEHVRERLQSAQSGPGGQ